MTEVKITRDENDLLVEIEAQVSKCFNFSNKRLESYRIVRATSQVWAWVFDKNPDLSVKDMPSKIMELSKNGYLVTISVKTKTVMPEEFLFSREQ